MTDNKINIDQIIPMSIFANVEPISIDLVYANKSHKRNIFKTALYHSKATMWAQYDMARIIILTARKLHAIIGGKLVLQDCLRTIESQKKMQETEIVKSHPEWQIGENRLLAPPGHGGHPRGMAIDVCLLDKDGELVNMGTEFDEMTAKSARDYTGFSNDILDNRKMLENAFLSSASDLGLELLPLPSEWWDFRFPASTYSNYAPLNDSDLPKQMQMTSIIENGINDFSNEHFENLKNDILKSLN